MSEEMTARNWMQSLFGSGNNIYFYGAGQVASNVYRYLKQQCLHNNIKGVIVGDREDSTSFFDKHEVEPLDDYLDSGIRLLIAITPRRQDEIREYLIKRGVNDNRIIQLPESIYKQILSDLNDSSRESRRVYDLVDTVIKTNLCEIEDKIKLLERKVESLEKVIALSFENDKDENEDKCPEVSVIIPIYNSERYLDEMLRSVLFQTVTNIEIICIDDGSTDRTSSILDEYGRHDQRITVIHQENKGAAAARNVGIRMAKGEYIYFLDSDDWIDSYALAILIKYAKTNGLEILYFDGQSFCENNASQKDKDYYRGYYRRTHRYDGVYDGKKMLVEFYKNNELRVSPCLQFIKRSFLLGAGVLFQEGIIYEDNIFTIQNMLMSERTGYLQDELFHRRVRNDSVMTGEKGFRHVWGYLNCYLRLEELLENNIVEEDVREVVRTIANKFLGHARSRYKSLDDDQKALWRELTKKEQKVFNALIL